MNSRGSFREPQILLRDQNKAMSFTSNISNAPFPSSKDIISSITVVRERLVPVHFLDLCDSREPLTLYTCQSVFPHSLGASFPLAAESYSFYLRHFSNVCWLLALSEALISLYHVYRTFRVLQSLGVPPSDSALFDILPA